MRGDLRAGALERLNEMAIERCDVPLLEDDDVIELDLEVMEQLLQ